MFAVLCLFWTGISYFHGKKKPLLPLNVANAGKIERVRVVNTITCVLHVTDRMIVRYDASTQWPGLQLTVTDFGDAAMPCCEHVTGTTLTLDHWALSA